MNRDGSLELPHIVEMVVEAVETPTVSLRKFTEQSGRKSHSKEKQTSVCDELTPSFSYPTKIMNNNNESLWISYIVICTEDQVV